MSDERALFEAICAYPEEDTPRLAYADWLQENGDEHQRAQAEYIRAQIERHRMPPEDDSVDMAERRAELEEREQELARHPAHNGYRPWAYIHAQPPPGTPEGVKYLYGHGAWAVRGFRGFATGTPAALAAAGEALFELYPVHGFFGDEKSLLTGEVAEQLLASKWLSRIRRLELNLGAPLVEPLFQCGHLAKLENLKLRFPAAELPSAPASGEPGPLGKLRSLRLQFTHEGRSGDDAVRRIAGLLPENSLTELAIPRPERRVSDFLPAITSHERFCNLERLEINIYTIRDGRQVASMEPLVGAAFWPKLRSLRLTMGFDGSDAVALAKAAPAPELRRLDLGWNHLTTAGLAALLESPVLESVTELRLDRGQFGDEGVKLLAQCPSLGNLTSLDVAECNLGPKGVKAIVEAPWAAHLVRLNLRGNPIKKAGVEALVALGRLPRLRRINLFNTAKTNELRKQLGARFGKASQFDV